MHGAFGFRCLVLLCTCGLSAADPVIWTTYLGGRFNDSPTAIVVDADGAIWVGGTTQSPDFPTTAGALRTRPPRTRTYGRGPTARVIADQSLGFLSKLSSDGRVLRYSTYVGGSDSDSVASVSADAFGGVYVGGVTSSPDLPVTPTAPQARYGGKAGARAQAPGDGFVMRFSPDGEATFSTFLGGESSDAVAAVAAGPDSTVFATGSTVSTDFPRGQAPIGSVDGFLVKIDTRAGGISWGLRFGGRGSTTPHAIALASNGHVFVAGTTEDTSNQPKTDAKDAFIAEINGRGELLSVVSYGGSKDDSGVDIEVGSGGSIYMAGHTQSPDLKTSAGAFQRRFQGGTSDSYVVKQARNRGRSYATYLGAPQWERIFGIALDKRGRVHAVGHVPRDTEFPISSGVKAPPSGVGQHIFYAVLSADGSALDFSLRRGGNSQGRGRFRITQRPRVAVGRDGEAYVVADTTDDVAASAGAMQRTRAGGHEPVIFCIRPALPASN